MAMTIDQLAAEAMSLPSEARALLADRLVESLDDAAVGRFDELWAAERGAPARGGAVGAAEIRRRSCRGSVAPGGDDATRVPP